MNMEARVFCGNMGNKESLRMRIAPAGSILADNSCVECADSGGSLRGLSRTAKGLESLPPQFSCT